MVASGSFFSLMAGFSIRISSFFGWFLVYHKHSAFDKTRIHNICDTIPKIAQQVIIFIKDTDGEVAEEHMGEKIGSKWLLTTLTKTQTNIDRR